MSTPLSKSAAADVCGTAGAHAVRASGSEVAAMSIQMSAAMGSWQGCTHPQPAEADDVTDMCIAVAGPVVCQFCHQHLPALPPRSRPSIQPLGVSAPAAILLLKWVDFAVLIGTAGNSKQAPCASQILPMLSEHVSWPFCADKCMTSASVTWSCPGVAVGTSSALAHAARSLLPCIVELHSESGDLPLQPVRFFTAIDPAGTLQTGGGTDALPSTQASLGSFQQ